MIPRDPDRRSRSVNPVPLGHLLFLLTPMIIQVISFGSKIRVPCPQFVWQSKARRITIEFENFAGDRLKSSLYLWNQQTEDYNLEIIIYKQISDAETDIP